LSLNKKYNNNNNNNKKEMMWWDVNVDVWEAARLLSQQRISTQVQSLGIYAKP
jgi:hypothetical protein